MTRLSLQVFPILAAVLSGCGGVVSTAPASDDATSRYDERLVGFWQVDDDASATEKSSSPHKESILAIGRKKDAERVFELVGVTLRADKQLETSRDEFTATTIDRKDYASLRHPLEEKSDSKVATWFVVRYEMPDVDTLRVLAMDEKAVDADVKAGKIPGKSDAWKALPTSDPFLSVTLSASTDVLRAYLEQRGDAVFATGRPLVLRRLRLR